MNTLQKTIRASKRTIASMALLFVLLGVPAAFAQESFRPTLSVPIPNVQFSNMRVQESDEQAGISGYLDIPWIAQYIQGVYLYGVSIAGVIAGVTIVIGGFQYMTGKVAEGKEKIKRSLVAVTLMFSSFLILKTINPDLTYLITLKIKSVKRETYDELLSTTTTDTAGDNAPSSKRSSLTASAYVPHFSACPYTPSGATDKEKRAQFYERVQYGGFVRGATTRDRAQQIAELTTLCQVALGSCGQTAGVIQSLATTVGPTRTGDPCFDIGGALPRGSEGVCINKYGRKKKEVPTEIGVLAHGWRCETFSKPHNASWDKYRKTDCANSANLAQEKVTKIFKEQAASGKMTGWPDEWLNELKAGDYVKLYTGNEDLSGRHAVTFLGWTSSGWMLVVSGNAGKPTGVSEYCVRSSCGDHMVPIIGIYDPLP